MNQQVKIVVCLAVFVAIVWFIYEIRGILAPFGLAFVLAYVLAPVVDRMEGRGLGRTWSILLVFLIAFASLGFGAFQAGGKLTGQMVELSDGFMRRESIEKAVVIANSRDVPMVVEGVSWGADNGKRAFAFGEEYKWPLEVGPASDFEVFVRFAPEDHEPVANELQIHYRIDDVVQIHRIAITGNGIDAEASANTPQSGWVHEALGDQPMFSHHAIKFGKAGPNVMTNISARASEIQPMLQPFLQPFFGEDFKLSELVKEHGERLTETMLGGTTVFLGGVVSGLTFVVIVPFVAFFFLKEGRRLTRTMIELVPNVYFELCLNLLHQINGQIGGYIRGQILATTVVSILAVSGLTLIEVKYALPLGVLAGLANMIPFLGPLIGFISASIVALATGGGISLVVKVGIVFLLIQLIDNVLIQPTVVAKSVEMHPLVVLFVVMVGSQLMGIVGMLIAVPLTGIIKVSSQTIYEGVRGYRLE